jgi:hypothetical protein
MSIGKSSLVIIAGNLRQNWPAGNDTRRVRPGGTIELPTLLHEALQAQISQGRPRPAQIAIWLT